MGLWIDKSTPRIEDLERIDTRVSQVATLEGIDVAAVIATVQEEIDSQLEGFLNEALGDVVVTERLRRWSVYAGLAMIYRTAYFSQMSERYEARWKEYESRARQARQENFEAGVGRTNY